MASATSTKNIIIIAGPTAVGKTATAIQVATHFNTAIISADSRQCYKELNIGVARPSADELKKIPHYFIASHHVTENINAAFYEKYVLQLLNDLFQQQDVVVVSGGTGLYIKALAEGLDNIPDVPASVRKNIIENYHAFGISWLQQQLLLKDAHFFNHGEMQNPQRMMRALEVVETTGTSIINFRQTKKNKQKF